MTTHRLWFCSPLSTKSVECNRVSVRPFCVRPVGAVAYKFMFVTDGDF